MMDHDDVDNDYDDDYDDDGDDDDGQSKPTWDHRWYTTVVCHDNDD